MDAADEDSLCYEPAEIIDGLTADAMYLGFGDLIPRQKEGYTPRDAMAVLGRMLERCRLWCGGSASPVLGDTSAGEPIIELPDPMTAREAATFLRLGRNTVYGLCKSGRLRHHRAGPRKGAIRIRKADAEQFQRDAERHTEATAAMLRHL